ncbi:MAG TPA: FkbM family methyltransferase [Bacteroidia bacterium]|nr:FkbM family methyltransferase [Bacteroidia bacterium]
MFFKDKSEKNINKKISYSQCGEDLIIDFIFVTLKIDKPSYLDIGAHHPWYLSNSAFFYLKQCKGVTVEPDPSLFEVIKKERPADISLNVGVGLESGESADFYIMNIPTLNTFSKTEAERYAAYPGKEIKKVVKLPLLTVNEIIQKQFQGKTPNFVSIDVEGMDLEIVSSFDFNKYRPEVFCIETLTYTENNSERKITEIIDYMLKQGYFLYADTYINSVFVDEKAWKNR